MPTFTGHGRHCSVCTILPRLISEVRSSVLSSLVNSGITTDAIICAISKFVCYLFNGPSFGLRNKNIDEQPKQENQHDEHDEDVRKQSSLDKESTGIKNKIKAAFLNSGILQEARVKNKQTKNRIK